jgi:hypothetical protein
MSSHRAGFQASPLRALRNDRKPNWGDNLSIVGILIVIILVLLVIYLVRRVL